MMGSDQYCLKWNNHWANLVRVFNSLRESGTFVDVTLACEGQQLNAHRLVLSSCSPYFKQLLVSHPDRHPIIILKDVRFSELQNLIQFIYNGEVSVEQQDLASLLGTAKELQIRGLTDTDALSTTSIPSAKAHSPEWSAPNKQSTNCISSIPNKPSEDKPTNLSLRTNGLAVPSSSERSSPSANSPSERSREGSPISKKRKLSQDIQPDVTFSSITPGSSTENQNKQIINEMDPDGKENVEPELDITKHLKDKPPDSSKKDSTDESDVEAEQMNIDAPEVILEEDDSGIITTNGTSSPVNIPHTSASVSPVEPPISSTTPHSLSNQQVSFLQQALAMNFQQPMHFLQNSLEQQSKGPQSMSPTGFVQAKNILNLVDILKAVGGGAANLPPNMQTSLSNTTRGMNSISPPGLQSPNGSSPILNNGTRDNERNPLTCHICGRIMPSMQVLEEHVRIHEEEKPYKCEQCGQRYKYQSAFQRHQEQNHTAKLPGDKPYRCDVCGQCFKYHKSFTKHRANHDLLDNFLKTEPGEEGKGTIRALQETYLQRLLHPSFPGNEGLNTSIKEEIRDSPEHESLKDAKSPCMVSSTSVPMPFGMENGEIKEEEEDIDIDEIVPDIPCEGEEDSQDMPTGKFFYCTNCKLTFRDSKGFEGHCRLSPECSTDTLKEVSVGGDISVTSIPSSDASTNASESGSQGTVTPQSSSNLIFSSPPGMLYTLVSGMPPTSSTFQSTSVAPTILNLSKFVNIHGVPNTSGNSLRPQDNLAFNFSNAGNGGTVGSLLAGMEEERPFKCPYCQKGFKGRENLKLHIRTHTGEKPYNCGVCGKAFGGRSDMNRHLRIHTGEKPYPCKVCGKKFARADYLSKHITTHLGIPFAKPVHSLQQSLQNLENMQNLQNLENMQNLQNSVTFQSLSSALPALQSLQNVPGLQNLQNFQNLQNLQSLQSSNLQTIAPPTAVSIIHNSKEEIPNLSK